MTNIDFFSLLEKNIWLFCCALILVLVIFIKIAKKTSDSWLNPVRIELINACIGYSIVLFLYFTGQISQNTFIYVLTSITFFWIVFCFQFPQNTTKCNLRIINESYYIRSLFFLLYFGLISITLFSYSRFGIPLFSDISRLNTYDGSGGFGIILRVTSFSQIFCLFYLFHNYSKGKIGLKHLILWISPLILFGVLSGSRSSFLQFIFAYWGFNKFYLGKSIYLSKYKSLMAIFLVVSITTFALQLSTNYIEASNSFLRRVVASGDIYWGALPDETWKDVVIKTPLKDLFAGFLAPLRLISDYDDSVGLQVFQQITGDYSQIAGPNELFPVASLIYFGYTGGLVFSLFQAFFFCFLARKFYRQSDSLLFSAFFYYSFKSCIIFMGPFRDAVGYMFNVFLNIILVLVLCMILAMLPILSKTKQPV